MSHRLWQQELKKFYRYRMIQALQLESDPCRRLMKKVKFND
ncbi:hypothetical protein D1AOALGA4SA_10914 [Olavius algarvensis Delta 1 endosymbiont]|nr:hypothetical protein D1AOALGA4SA_10914 [Olavius algarvensis Delta 1 endosymbiont]